MALGVGGLQVCPCTWRAGVIPGVSQGFSSIFRADERVLVIGLYSRVGPLYRRLNPRDSVRGLAGGCWIQDSLTLRQLFQGSPEPSAAPLVPDQIPQVKQGCQDTGRSLHKRNSVCR